MSEPITSGIIGTKLILIVSGFFGGVLSLSFIQGVTRKLAFITIMVGVVASYFLSPLFSDFIRGVFKFEVSRDTMGAIGFLVGFTAMSLLPALRKAFVSRVATTLAPNDPPGVDK